MKTQRSTLNHLIAILSDGKYHDGTSIGKKLNLTRSAVWKSIKKLQEYGIKIDSIKGKGYALLEPLILLDSKMIKKKLNHEKIHLEVFESLHSTNDYLKTFLQQNKRSPAPRVCFAEQQKAGRGRLNRQWHSPFGQNIYFSCLYFSYKDLSELAGLSLVVSLAVAKTLQSYHLPKPILVKWPNDVVYDHQKISGNLIEVQAESNGMCAVIIGIGINVNMQQVEDDVISQPWTSLSNILGESIDRNVLAASLINYLFNYLEKFEQKGLEYFISEWNKADKLFGKEMILKQDKGNIQGIAQGINQHGHLLMKLKDGSIKAFSSGDTAVV